METDQPPDQQPPHQETQLSVADLSGIIGISSETLRDAIMTLSETFPGAATTDTLNAFSGRFKEIFSTFREHNVLISPEMSMIESLQTSLQPLLNLPGRIERMERTIAHQSRIITDLNIDNSIMRNNATPATSGQQNKKSKKKSSTNNPAPPESQATVLVPSTQTQPTPASQPQNPINPPPPSAQLPPKPSPKPKADPPAEIKFILRISSKPDNFTQMPAYTMVRVINEHINGIVAASGKAKLLAAVWNASGNCVLTFSPSSEISVIRDLKSWIIDTFAKNCEADFQRNAKWSRIVLGGVKTSNPETGTTFTTEDLLLELLSNAQVTGLNITLQPRWVKMDVTGLATSSISFSFTDSDGTAKTKLLKSPFYMFGSPVSTKEWRDKKKILQCFRCWKLGHTATACRSTPRCRLCGYPHKESDHPSHCKLGCVSEQVKTPESCHHQSCLNCKGEHPADDPNCLKRREIEHKINSPSNYGWKPVGPSGSSN